MAINLTVRGGTTRQYPQPGDSDLFGEATNWANDVTVAINQSPTTSTSASFDAIVGTAANVSAGVATHSDIATAIAAVSANDRIFILENTYEPSAQIDIDKALTIIGQGEGAVIEGDNIATGSIVKISASGVTFENCKIIQGSGTPDYALEIAAAIERTNINLKADGTFATSLFLNSSDAGAICGFITYDTSSILFGGESQYVEQLKIQDQTTPAYNMVIQSDSDGTALTADRILTFDVNDGARTVDLSENFTIGDGFDVSITAEDAAGAITLDNSNFEVENTDATQRLFKIVSAKAGDTTLTFQEDFTLSDGNDVTMVAEDAAASITWDNVNFEVESTDGTQRTFKITSAKAGDTTLTLQENFTIGDGFDVSITSEDTANSIVLDEQNFEVEGEGTAQQLLKLVNASNAAATLTIDGTSGAVNQDVQTTASPTFVGPTVQKITRDSNDITVETTTSGDVVLKSADNNVIVNKADATNASTHTFKFGDDTGGISGVRNNSGALELNSAGGGWVDAASYVTLTGTQTLTNKTLTSPAINGANQNMGTASNTNRILLPNDTTTNLDLLTDTAALLAYDTTLSKVVFNNGTGWAQLGTGTGVGGYIKYSTNAGNSFSHNTTTIVDFEDQGDDAGSWVTTGAAWKAEPNDTGLFLVHGNITLIAGAGDSQRARLSVYVNGVQYEEGLWIAKDTIDAAYTGVGCCVTSFVKLTNSADYIDLRLKQDNSSAAARSLSAINARNYIFIIKLRDL